MCIDHHAWGSGHYVGAILDINIHGPLTLFSSVYHAS